MPILGLYTQNIFVSGFFHSAQYSDNHPCCWIYQTFVPFYGEEHTQYLHCMNLPQFVYPFSCSATGTGWLISGWLCLLWINLIEYSYKRVFVGVCFQFSWIGVARSEGKFIFSFLINCQTAFQTGCAIGIFPPSQSMRILVVSNPLQHLVWLFGLFHFRHTCGCVMVCFSILL